MKMRVDLIPENVSYILNKLKLAGFKSYIVGGCVRDIFLGRQPHDWDICTSATPHQVLDIFSNYNTIPTGLQHGTVTVVIDHVGYEITTFRIDGNYSDNRRPDTVRFTEDIVLDLSRRDFTINAMAYNPIEGLIDPFGGFDDLSHKVIRCVGNAKDRFDEDALRMLRAIRFACQLDFRIDPEIGWLLSNTEIIYKLQNISQERITSEFIKMITCKTFHNRFVWHIGIFTMLIPEILPCVNFQQRHPVHKYDVLLHTMKALELCESDDLVVRLAVLFHDIGKPHCLETDKNGVDHFYGHGEKSAEITDNILKRMKFDNVTREAVVESIRYHDAQFEVNEKHVKRWLNRIDEKQFDKLLILRHADIMGQNPKYLKERLDKIASIRKVIEKVISENHCFKLKDLAVNGKDLMKIGIQPGPTMGATLNLLLDEVICGNISNEKEDLLSFVNNLKVNRIIKENENV